MSMSGLGLSEKRTTIGSRFFSAPPFVFGCGADFLSQTSTNPSRKPKMQNLRGPEHVHGIVDVIELEAPRGQQPRVV